MDQGKKSARFGVGDQLHRAWPRVTIRGGLRSRLEGKDTFFQTERHEHRPVGHGRQNNPNVGLHAIVHDVTGCRDFLEDERRGRRLTILQKQLSNRVEILQSPAGQMNLLLAVGIERRPGEPGE